MESKRKTLRRIGRILFTLAIGIFIAAGIFVAVRFAGGEKKEEIVYKEVQVKYGNLTVGISAGGTVDIGTVEQKFELDMSALRKVESSSSGSSSSGSGGGSSGSFGGSNMSGAGGMGSAGGMAGMMPSTGTGNTGNVGALNLFGQMFGSGGTLVGTGDDASLTIAGVRVSVGQRVSAGDVLYELEAESVSDLEKELKDNVAEAKSDLDVMQAEQKLSRQTAKYTYESALAYGEYAGTEYDQTMQALQDTVDGYSKMIEETEASLAEYEEKLLDITQSWEDAAKTLGKCQYSLSHTDQEDAGLYVYYYNMTAEAKQTADSLETKKENYEDKIEQAKKDLETAKKNYEAAQRSLAQGELSAKQTFALRELAYATAQEVYDVTLARLEQDMISQEEIYQDAQEKWAEYSKYIAGTSVLSQYDGVITGIELKKGDSLKTGSALVTLYDLDDVGVDVKVYEEDMKNISLGSEANVSFTAYPDELFQAAVSEISEASTDSKGNVYYTVTVAVQGDVSGLFQGMTGAVTFVTGESEETLYVSKRAITTQGGISYVKIRQEDGTVVSREVKTGFTDGAYTQIKEGLSEGDTVLIESIISNQIENKAENDTDVSSGNRPPNGMDNRSGSGSAAKPGETKNGG